MLSKEKIRQDVDVYAEDFTSELFNLFQCCDCGSVSWRDLLDIGFEQIMEHLTKAYNYDWEE